jgi:eukaryotic-like serine/threonine-protein kinase
VSQDRRRLAGRYSVERSVGHGGMAQVYEGTDTVLGRTVAIKVLAPQYARDDAFVARFRREAQAAAKLNHPGVVSVYDTGSDDGVHYIVMEYVAGRTLAEVLEQEGRLQPERAAEIAAQVGQALSFAHAAGIIHRDVKPANIMLSAQGSVKVMDFGIARALSTQTLTQTATVLGTASYLSPEQAQGEAVDARSDLYSLGVVLYEMLTGRPPFTGDTPVAVAYKHVREDPRLPSEVAPEVPSELDAVVMKAMAKNPANRYASASEMAEDLERAIRGEPVLATPILPGTDTQVIRRTHEGTAVLPAPIREEEEPGRGRRTLVGILLALLILGGLGLLLYFLANSLVGGAKTVKVPNVKGENIEAARLELRNRNLVSEIDFKASDTPQNQVISQDPKPGTKVDENSTVHLVVSGGPQTVTVPDITGKTEEEARDLLKGAKLKLGQELSESPSDTILAGQIITQTPPAGRNVPVGTAIDYVVSTGPQQTAVPNVVCKTVGQARAAIKERGLVPEDGGQADQPNLQCPEPNRVASTDPGPGELVDPGTTVTYFTSFATPESPSPSPSEG